MRCIFSVIPNAQGQDAIVRGKNEYGEYVVSIYNHRSHVNERIGTYYSNDFDDACKTAIAEVHGLKALEQFVTQAWR